MTNNNFSQVAAFIWSVADLLRGDFKQSQYGRVILPFTLLRRLECVLAPNKADVLAAYEKVKTMPLPEEAKEKMILKAASEQKFFNTSELDLASLGQKDIRANLSSYIQSFSKDAREIFEHFKFDEFIGLLDDANLLYKVVQKFGTTDLSYKAVSNHEMGLVFEELIRRFAESSNETAGEHFTPRDIVRLTTGLVFGEDDDLLNQEGIIRTVYDPTAGTGGFLSSGAEYVREHNPDAVIKVYGQELNPESYAICKADMLIKGQDVQNIKLGNTLSNDQLSTDKFDYMLSNPPFGVDWKKIEQDIKDEHEQKGFDGRFGAGLPRVSDGSLLFLMHLISKMRDKDDNGQGSRIGIILNGSPLFTGSAGSGESEIRRYILEADLLEAIVALPTDMFYNTGIATYVWVLTNKKDAERKGKVHLINGANLSTKMRKSLGSKRNYLTDTEIATITKNYGAFEAVDTLTLDGESDQQKPFASKIFNSYEFGYRRVTIERPLRLSAQLSDERIESLRFAPKPFNAVMQFLYSQYGERRWGEENYGEFYAHQEEYLREIIKKEFSELKEKDIKTLFEPKIWLDQRDLMRKAKNIQRVMGVDQWDDFNQFQDRLAEVVSDINFNASKYNLYLRFGKLWESDNLEKNKSEISSFIKIELVELIATQTKKILNKDTWQNNQEYLSFEEFSSFDYLNYLTHKKELIAFRGKEQKQFIDAITWKNADAEPVINKVLKTKANPLYGQFDYQGRVVEFVQDGDLRDAENIALDPSQTTTDLIESYFKREVQPHVADAWINADKRDAIDGEIGIVGYEIPFNRHFYVYEPPRDLAEIDADLDAVSREIMQLLQEVHS